MDTQVKNLIPATSSALLARVQGVNKLYQALCAPLLARYALTQAEADILLFLANNPPYDTARDIVEKRRLAKSHVSVGVEALAARGLVERWYRDGNRKTIHLRLTDAAAPMIEEGRAVQRRFAALLIEGFTPEETAPLEAMLMRMGQNADAAIAALNKKK